MVVTATSATSLSPHDETFDDVVAADRLDFDAPAAQDPAGTMDRRGLALTVSIAVLLGGLILTFALWFGIRDREVGAAEGELVALTAAQSEAVAREIAVYTEALNAIAGVASVDDDLSDAELLRYLETIELVERGAFTDVVIAGRAEGAAGLAELTARERAMQPSFTPILSGPEDGVHYIVTRRIAGDGLAAFSGVDVMPNPALADGLGQMEATGTSVVLVLDPSAAEGSADSELPVDLAVVTATPITDADGAVTGAVIGRIQPATLLAGLVDGDTEMVLELDGLVVASSAPPGDLGVAVGDAQNLAELSPIVVGDWSARGFSDRLSPEHTGSTVVLVAGLVLTLTIAVLVRALGGYADALHRLRTIEHHARHDRLTGLTNRSGLTETLRACLEERSVNEVVGVLFLDLDRLKVVNDSIGHSAGDEVLQIVAKRLAAIIREQDVVGRFGGDEFVIVTRGLRSVRDLTAAGDRVMAALAEPAELSDGSTQMLGASIGIAYVARGSATSESLLRDADVAMYRAKENGGNRYVVFDAELRSRAVARLEIERELRRAIRSGQLIVHYQPIVSTEGGHIDRLEALVRWQHDTRGLVPPGQFLAVAAESGLIIEVGEHVLRESCRQASVWSAAVGRPIRVSVNVAERQLVETALVDTVRRVLNETGLAPEQLELEITEELIVDKIDDRLEMLRELRDMGVLLAIDDFGTSRASLGQLKRLDMVSTLKIDRAFVMDLANDPVDVKIVTAIVALAKSMGMEVVAEGVEETEQATLLRDLGVDLLQGFLFHRPAPADQMAPMLASQADWLVAT